MSGYGWNAKSHKTLQMVVHDKPGALSLNQLINLYLKLIGLHNSVRFWI
jgi:hypothetical protein